MPDFLPMKKLEVFDPALCCATGVCGPSPDAQLSAFAATVHALKNRAEIIRYNLAQEPGAFASQPLVSEILQREGPEALPVVLIDGQLAMKGVYPTADQLAQLLGIELNAACCESDQASGCCGGGDGDSGSACCDAQEATLQF